MGNTNRCCRTCALFFLVLSLSSVAGAAEFEAENAVLVGCSPREHAAASGGYRVAFFDAAGDSLQFDAVPDGKALRITYSLGRPDFKQCSIYVDGVDVATVRFPPTGDWNVYATVDVNLDISTNLRLQLDDHDQAANRDESCASIDKIAVLADPTEPPSAWRSSLYPEDWHPGHTDPIGRFLHDFSYAGYHMGERRIPDSPPGPVLDVTQPPYNADGTGSADATAAIQAAIDDAGSTGGGIVFLPEGTYRVAPGSNSYALRVRRSGVVIRGAGPGRTFIFNDDEYMRKKSVILFRPSSGDWHSPISGSEVAITRDLPEPTRVIPVADTSTFAVGDWAVLRTDCTDDFIDDHLMTGIWNSGLKGITFYRQVRLVDAAAGTIRVDVPTRHYLKVRDNARVYKVAPHIEEVGLEDLSIGMRENLTGGLGSNDYTVPGTAAYEVHGSHAITYFHVTNGWIRNVQTYRPAANTSNWHTVSNIILLSKCRGVTVRDCYVARPEYEGGGGNGYGYTLRSNDCLVVDCTAHHTRHNYDFKSMWSSGNVIHFCNTLDAYLASDFHMHLSPANLFDCTFVDGDYLDARYRPYGTTLHGHTTTESVFWNTYGTAACGSRLIVSRQWRWGYVIGTSGPVHNVQRGTQDNTAPQDFLEGEGSGDSLVPQSLYLDQLARRLLRQNPGQSAVKHWGLY